MSSEPLFKDRHQLTIGSLVFIAVVLIVGAVALAGRVQTGNLSPGFLFTAGYLFVAGIAMFAIKAIITLLRDIRDMLYDQRKADDEPELPLKNVIDEFD